MDGQEETVDVKDWWAYGLNGWARTELPSELSLDRDWLMVTRYGDQCAGLSAVLYERGLRGPREMWWVAVQTPGSYYNVLIRDLPSLLAFLNYLLPTLRQSHDLEQIDDAAEEKAKRARADYVRRGGKVFTQTRAK